MATMAVALGALQIVLEEGNKGDWFGSPFIFRVTITAIVFLSLFLWIEPNGRKPLVELGLSFRRNFGLGTAANCLL